MTISMTTLPLIESQINVVTNLEEEAEIEEEVPGLEEIEIQDHSIEEKKVSVLLSERKIRVKKNWH